VHLTGGYGARLKSNFAQMKLVERCHAALAGIAVGDALGKMTEGYWPPEIGLRYGGRVETFLSPQQPHSSTVWAYAEVTDDTRFTLLIAESIISCGKVDAGDIIRRILEQPIKGWPGWDEFRTKAESGERATQSGNGAPIRVAPIGMLHSTAHMKHIISDVEQACSCTHNTRSALSAACAVAVAYSAALEGYDKRIILEAAIEGATLGNHLGEDDLCPDVARRLQWVRKNVGKGKSGSRRNGLNPGFPAWEGATFALALVMLYDSAKDAILAAVNAGGDADSIASMAGGIVAARNPDTLPQEWVEIVKRENNLDFTPLAEQLVALRR
jgi:ADP-ribosylglycohydrolase